MDQISLERLALLHPKLVSEAINLLEEVEKVLTGRASVRVTQTLRTIAEQDALYAQGRTTKGQIVTNARGGSSYHNYGLALDFTLILDGRTVSWETNKDYDGDKIPDWMEVVKIFKDAGWTWGGDFKSIKDAPHFEKTFGYSVKQLFDKYKKKDFIKGTSYVNI